MKYNPNSIRATAAVALAALTTGSGGTADATATSRETSLSATVSCAAARGGAGQSFEATVGSCPDDAAAEPTADPTASVDEAGIGAEIGCLDAGAWAAESAASLSSGNCPGEQDAARVDGSALDSSVAIGFSCLVGMAMAEESRLDARSVRRTFGVACGAPF